MCISLFCHPLANLDHHAALCTYCRLVLGTPSTPSHLGTLGTRLEHALDLILSDLRLGRCTICAPLLPTVACIVGWSCLLIPMVCASPVLITLYYTRFTIMTAYVPTILPAMVQSWWTQYGTFNLKTRATPSSSQAIGVTYIRRNFFSHQPVTNYSSYWTWLEKHRIGDVFKNTSRSIS
ncbi:hypothetical protein HD806DRAFT_499273 [Xylariaceae sp. AK1471]|nr:hypothetical protein HD806DRAFT_499273 [Xylariaceae sp. AK1471]